MTLGDRSGHHLMRIVVTQNVTLDGVIEAIDDWFGPAGTADVDTSDLEAVMRSQTAEQDGLLLGRQTFEAFRGYWPLQTDDTTGVAAHLDRVEKYVVSRTLGEPGWAHTTVLRGDLVAEVGRLRAAPGGDVCV